MRHSTRDIVRGLGLGLFVSLVATPTLAQQATSLDELLNRVRSGWRTERAENQKREDEFKAARSEQRRLLDAAKAELRQLEEQSERLEAKFEENEAELVDLGDLLTEKLGTLGELFGVVRQVAGDTAGNLEASLISAQIPDRTEFLVALGQEKSLPSIDKLERLWFELQREMTLQGQVVRFPATVVSVEGEESQEQVVRVGVFTALADGQYLRWVPEVGKLVELGRQPPARYLSTVAPFMASQSGLAPLAVDPTSGVILSLLVQTPDNRERIAQGGPVGYAILLLGAMAVLLGVARLLYVVLVGAKVRAQLKNPSANKGNPLGRVLAVYEENKRLDAETLERKLDEAILKESTRLDRFIWLVKVISVVAPLMGLLGTVTGMIQTFQAITLFGTGDPKMMASGISEALVTTMLGLTVAIPLVLLHSIMVSASRRVVDTLDEQSAGIVAMRAEQEFDHDGAK